MYGRYYACFERSGSKTSKSIELASGKNQVSETTVLRSCSTPCIPTKPNNIGVHARDPSTRWAEETLTGWRYRLDWLETGDDSSRKKEIWAVCSFHTEYDTQIHIFCYFWQWSENCSCLVEGRLFVLYQWSAWNNTRPLPSSSQSRSSIPTRDLRRSLRLHRHFPLAAAL